MAKNKPLWALLAVVAALTALRLWLGAIMELLPEEAYYWTYAQHPALGYFDHPPMVGWIIWLGTRLAGNTECGARLVNTLLAVGACGLLFATGRVWFGDRVATWAALLVALLPVFVGIGLIVTPDGALVFFWTGTLWAVTQALRTRRTVFWLLAGGALGAGLLAKYYALLLAPSLVVFLFFSREHRFWLRKPQPWLAGLVALAVFSPVIIWNATHGWASFLFQSTRTAEPNPHPLRDVGVFWLYQLAVLGGIGLPLFVLAAVRGIKRGWILGEDRWNFAVSFSLPLFALFAAASFKTQVHINWTAPAFLSLALAGAAVFLEGIDHPAPKRAGWWRGAGWATAVVCVVAIFFGHLSLATGRPAAFAYSHAGGWRQLAARVETAGTELQTRTGQQPFFIGADKYNLAAELGFYLQRPADCVNLYALGAGGLGFRYWTDLQDFAGRPAIVVAPGPPARLITELKAHFDRVDEPVSLALGGRAARWNKACLIGCYGYRPDPRATR